MSKLKRYGFDHRDQLQQMPDGYLVELADVEAQREKDLDMIRGFIKLHADDTDEIERLEAELEPHRKKAEELRIRHGGRR